MKEPRLSQVIKDGVVQVHSVSVLYCLSLYCVCVLICVLYCSSLMPRLFSSKGAGHETNVMCYV